MGKDKFLNIKGVESALRMLGPKLVTMFLNFLRIGPRMIARSLMELLRANLFTRLISCATLLVVDIVDLSKRRISKVQFARNVALSLTLIVCGTFGWNLGARWLIIEAFGSAVEIIGGMIGAGVFGFASSAAFDKVISKVVPTDGFKMRQIIESRLPDISEGEKKTLMKQISNSDLKKMFASDDKEAFADELIRQAQTQGESL